MREWQGSRIGEMQPVNAYPSRGKPGEHTRETYRNPCYVTEKANMNRDFEGAHVDLHLQYVSMYVNSSGHRHAGQPQQPCYISQYKVLTS